MQQRDVVSIETALIYMVGCTLVTVSLLAERKSRLASEYRRQLAMGQYGIGWLVDLKLDPARILAGEIIEQGLTVAEWASKRDPKGVVRTIALSSRVQAYGLVDALRYLTDCTLATVETLAVKRNRPLREYRWQQGIAQVGVDWLQKAIGRAIGGDVRIQNVVAVNQSVARWAAQYEV